MRPAYSACWLTRLRRSHFVMEKYFRENGFEHVSFCSSLASDLFVSSFAGEGEWAGVAASAADRAPGASSRQAWRHDPRALPARAHDHAKHVAECPRQRLKTCSLTLRSRADSIHRLFPRRGAFIPRRRQTRCGQCELERRQQAQRCSCSCRRCQE